MNTEGEARVVLTVPEAARFLRIGKRTLQALTTRGEIPFKRIGRRVVYPVRLLNEYLENKLQPGV